MALTEQERLYLENVLEQMALAEAAAEALSYSYRHRPEIRDDRDYDDAEWERWDALTARLARLADILTQRVFRAIDMAEFLPSGATFIDRINRAEKRGYIRSAYEWKEIREMHNQIVHEYAATHLLPLLQEYLLNNPGRLEPILFFSSCGRSPDRATGGHGREACPESAKGPARAAPKY